MPGLSSQARTAWEYRRTAEEVEASRRPPYSQPAPQQQFVDAALALLAGWANSDAPEVWLSGPSYAGPYPLRSELGTWLKTGRVSVAEALAGLTRIGVVPAAAVPGFVDSAPDPHSALVLQRALIARLADEGNLDAARAAAQHPCFGDEPWRGWRVLAAHFARVGDVEGYLALSRKLNGRSDKIELDRMRSTLITAITRRDGAEAGLRAAAALKTSPFQVLETLAERGDPQGLVEFIDSHPELATTAEGTGLWPLVHAVAAAVRGAPLEADHPDLGWVLDRVLSMDPGTTRDGMLLGLWPAVGDRDTLTRMRAAVRAPKYKREFGTLLPREVSRPD